MDEEHEAVWSHLWLRFAILGAFCIVLSWAVSSTCFQWVTTVTPSGSRTTCAVYGFWGAFGPAFFLGVALIVIGVAVWAWGWRD